MARTRQTKYKGHNTMALPPGQKTPSRIPMPAGKRAPEVITAKKNKGNYKIKFLLQKPKVNIRVRKKGKFQREIKNVRRRAVYLANIKQRTC